MTNFAKSALLFVVLLCLFTGDTRAQTEAERIAKLEAKLDQLTPVVQQVNDLKVQLAQLQGRFDSLDTKLNIVLGILVAIAVPVLGEVVKRISDKVSSPPPPTTPVSNESLVVDRFVEALKMLQSAKPGAVSPPSPPGSTSAAATSGSSAATAGA